MKWHHGSPPVWPGLGDGSPQAGMYTDSMMCCEIPAVDQTTECRQKETEEDQEVPPIQNKQIRSERTSTPNPNQNNEKSKDNQEVVIRIPNPQAHQAPSGEGPESETVNMNKNVE